jgi:AcrR family transcriptional regulator
MPNEDKRRQIMLSVEKLFTSKRYHEIKLDDVAEAAGVGKGTIYRYFEDKEDLFSQTMMSGYDDLCDLLARTSPEGAPFGEQLLQACEQMVVFYERRHRMMLMMHAEESRLVPSRGGLKEKWMEQRRKVIAALAAILGKGVAEGRIRDDVSCQMLAAILMGMLRTPALELVDAPANMRRHELIAELFLNGAARP